MPDLEISSGSALRVEGTFDDARASVVPWLVYRVDASPVIRVGTWQLDSSGGSVVFSGQHDNEILVVDATVGGVHHYFFFRAHVVPIGT